MSLTRFVSILCHACSFILCFIGQGNDEGASNSRTSGCVSRRGKSLKVISSLVHCKGLLRFFIFVLIFLKNLLHTQFCAARCASQCGFKKHSFHGALSSWSLEVGHCCCNWWSSTTQTAKERTGTAVTESGRRARATAAITTFASVSPISECILTMILFPTLQSFVHKLSLALS